MMLTELNLMLLNFTLSIILMAILGIIGYFTIASVALLVLKMVKKLKADVEKAKQKEDNVLKLKINKPE